MNDSDPLDVTKDESGKSTPGFNAATNSHPQRIGRYLVERVLGEGGFGLVYLAHDDRLNRLVAIKVPHSKLVTKPEDAEAYLLEARTVASLDHPNIVPVYDVGSDHDFPCYVVSKFISGNSLSRKAKSHRFDYRDVSLLVADIAEALHYAHKQGLVHRDVKPSNILIDDSGSAHLADFGLALREESFGHGPQFAGTPSYMSPEQARGEGHRVDGRSDIFSLGVVLYELLTGRKPFRGDTQAETLEMISKYEPRPLRQFDDRIPKELERICHMALAKRASDRYTTGKDFADDLRFFLKEWYTKQIANPTGDVKSSATETAARQVASTTVQSRDDSSDANGSENQDSHSIKIIPKGLRSFDIHDADFFLELLHGPRDRTGLPDSLRFWKTRIEECDPDSTFSVGLIYGPSGCGKSSLVKAGLLPRLTESVLPVYVESTPDETESRLMNGLRKRCPALSEGMDLKETLTALRRGNGIPVGKKVLVILDQFEQWLHTNSENENTDLVQALRQCDGGRVQCVVMVRDDFWMAVTRFMRELEVRLVEADNSAAVDLFPIRHAERVLTAFGRAFGTLPASTTDLTKNHQDFIKQSIAGLAEEGKIICVRLALFAEMMKGKSWTPAELKLVGGTKGVGLAFLEETFGGKTAAPELRYHEKAARAVLQSLLPDSGDDIKGEMKSYDELLEVSGYARRPKDFDDLIRVLDSEVRLITPTDLGGINDDEVAEQRKFDQKYFQLTHDYLVHSLRDWLTRKQEESKKGRAELALAERASIWNSRPESRQLPSFAQWLQIKWHTDKNRRTEPQNKMLAKADRYHAWRSLTAILLLITFILGGLFIRNAVVKQQAQTYSAALVDSLSNADILQVPNVIEDLDGYRDLAEPLLREQIALAKDDSPEMVRLALALLPNDASQLDFLVEQILVCDPKEFSVLRTALLPFKYNVCDSLWKVVQDDENLPSKRFQAAAALAELDPKDQRWQGISSFVTNHLTAVVSSLDRADWVEFLHPANDNLIGSLKAVHADRSHGLNEKEAAAYALSEYLQGKPDQLVGCILLADEYGEFSALASSLKPHAAVVKQQLLNEMRREMPAELDKRNAQLSIEGQQLRDEHWRRQSLAAVTLVQLGYASEVWPRLDFTPNPSLRSFIIHHLGKLGTDHNVLAAQLEIEENNFIARALTQSLGGLNSTIIPISDRTRIGKQLKTLFVEHPDSGIHSSASLTLRRWGFELPELPVGEPKLSDEQKAQVATLTLEVEDIRRRIAKAEEKLPIRQAIWERELTAKADLLHPAANDGLIFHFPLDETEGRETANAANEENVGVLLGPNEPKWISGVIGNGVLLDGNRQSFNCGQLFEPDYTDSFSLGCWFYADEDGERSALLSSWSYANGQSRGVAVESSPSGPSLLIRLHHQHWDDAIIVQLNPQSISDRWHHLFVTYDGSAQATGVRCFFDGRLMPTKTLVDSLTGTIDSGKPLEIGSQNGHRRPLKGAVDDVRIYDRQLSTLEVERLFQAGATAVANTPSETRSPEQQALLNDLYLRLDDNLLRLRNRLLATEKLVHDARWNSLRRWFVNEQGQTMVIVPPLYKGDSDYAWAISSHEVTLEEFLRSGLEIRQVEDIPPAPSSPALSISFPLAAEYCNWLNKQEGVPAEQSIYLPNENGEYDEGMIARADIQSKFGYRLPTVEEWELACLGRTTTSYHYGEPVALLTEYGFVAMNSGGVAHPVGSLLPNEIGLFDLHGNALELIHPTEEVLHIDTQLKFRSGAFWFLPTRLVTNEDTTTTSYLHRKYRDAGIRLVRTLPMPN